MALLQFRVLAGLHREGGQPDTGQQARRDVLVSPPHAPWRRRQKSDADRELGESSEVPVGGLILWHVVANDAPVVLLAFVLTEWLGATLQWFVLRKEAP